MAHDSGQGNIIYMGEEHSEDDVCTKNIIGFAETKLIKNRGKSTKRLIWSTIFKGKS
jgi:hypothetical protein